MKCRECEIDFPDELVQPMFTTKGSTMCCPICALEIKNKLHGINETKFNGQEANRLLKLARTYVRNLPKRVVKK